MAKVTTSRHFDAPPENMWKRVGGFDSIHEWHPYIASTALIDGGRRRQVTTADGGRIEETLLEEGPLFYTFRMDKSSLPFANFVSTIRVNGEDGGSVVQWEAEFEAVGVPEEEAVKGAQGFLQAGLDAL